MGQRSEWLQTSHQEYLKQILPCGPFHWTSQVCCNRTAAFPPKDDPREQRGSHAIHYGLCQHILNFTTFQFFDFQFFPDKSHSFTESSLFVLCMDQKKKIWEYTNLPASYFFYLCLQIKDSNGFPCVPSTWTSLMVDMMLMASPNSASAITIATTMGVPTGINVLWNITLVGWKWYQSSSPNLCRLRSLMGSPNLTTFHQRKINF